MPSAASPTRSTWRSASRPASSRSSVALRSAASRISRTCSDVPADSDVALRRHRLVAHAVHLVGDAAQVRVDGRRVVAAAADREVAALDVLSLHAALR